MDIFSLWGVEVFSYKFIIVFFLFIGIISD